VVKSLATRKRCTRAPRARRARAAPEIEAVAPNEDALLGVVLSREPTLDVVGHLVEDLDALQREGVAVAALEVLPHDQSPLGSLAASGAELCACRWAKHWRENMAANHWWAELGNADRILTRPTAS